MCLRTREPGPARQSRGGVQGHGRLGAVAGFLAYLWDPSQAFLFRVFSAFSASSQPHRCVLGTMQGAVACRAVCLPLLP